jgi:lipid II:glycine glycyltransferase (peptidoglycan interpeptide bridge formation enzyme)
MQSWDWSEVKKLDGYRVLRLGLYDSGDLVGGAITYLFPTCAEAQLAVVPDGPVLEWAAPDGAEAFRALVSAIETATEDDRVAAVRVEPRLETTPDVLRDLPRAPLDLVPVETLEVPLGPEAEMLARMKPKGRYNARLAARHGVTVATSYDPADVHELYEVIEATANYHGFFLEPKSFFINLARTLCPAMGRFAFARYRGMTLAAAFTVHHGDTVTFLYGGHLPLFPEVMASHALHWHVMREGAAEGRSVYDLYGYVSPGDPGHPYDGFSRFKDKLGGRPVRRIGSHDVIFYDRLADAALRTAMAFPGDASGGDE